MIDFKIIDRAIVQEWGEFKSIQLPFKEYEWTKCFIKKYNEYVRKGLLWCNITLEEKKIYYGKLLGYIPDLESTVYAHVSNCIEAAEFDKMVNILVNDIFKLQMCVDDFKYEEESTG